MKIRNGFVSNSSSSSFMLVMDVDLKIESAESFKQMMTWDCFKRHLAYQMKEGHSVMLTEEEWNSVTSDQMADILYRCYEITRRRYEGKSYKEAFSEIFDEGLMKRPKMPDIAEIRKQEHKYGASVKEEPLAYWEWEQMIVSERIKDAYDRYAQKNFNYNMYLMGKASADDDLRNIAFFSIGNDAWEIYEAHENGVFTDLEYKIIMDIRYLGIFKYLFDDDYVAFEDYS